MNPITVNVTQHFAIFSILVDVIEEKFEISEEEAFEIAGEILCAFHDAGILTVNRNTLESDLVQLALEILS